MSELIQTRSYDVETGENSVYIGGTEYTCKRLLQYVKNKDFWNEMICFTSKDENLTKGHIKYLESRLIKIVHEVDRYQLNNDNKPPISSLPRGERDAMETFIDNIRILLGSLGHKLLEPVMSVDRDNQPNSGTHLLYLKVNNLAAKAQITDEGFVVLKGSQAKPDTQPSLSESCMNKRQQLKETEKLILQGEQLVTSQDILFTSPSQAAAVLLGYPCSGPEYWVNSEEKTLKDIEKAEALGAS